VGKPYLLELESLAATYAWALNAPLAPLSERWRRFCSSSLVAVGSGGSFTAANLAVYLHERYTGCVAKAVTPLEAAHSKLNWGKVAALVLTARGGNPDVLGAFRYLARGEPQQLGTLCTRLESPLADLADEYGADCFDFELPTGKDGFLATNSLLASAVVLARLYGEAMGEIAVLPAKFTDLLAGCEPEMTHGSEDRLWKSETLIVLYSSCTRAAAVDLESKFSEAAIGNLQAVDYRNFAHGRHHWLARRGSSTGIIAFIADEVNSLARKTLKLIPAKIPTLGVDVGAEGPRAAIAALVHAIRLVGRAGQAVDLDPGRPHVPPFGRAIYHLNAFGARVENGAGDESAAIVRKSGVTIDALEMRNELPAWRQAHASFSAVMQRARFGGIVLDYDGTLCDTARRFEGPDVEVAKHLIRLAKGGTVIGIATGRGKSVRVALRKALPKTLWKQFVVGYYNGGDIGALKDDAHPDGSDVVDDSLKAVAKAIKIDTSISGVAQLVFRGPQITIEPNRNSNPEMLWQYLQQFLYQLNVPGVMALRSSHSMDVVAPFVTKQTVVDEVRNRIGNDHSILCIGDRGRWPGNDFTLLNNPHSLSVDEVSPDPARCWNLAPAGKRGVAATLFYFERLAASKDGVRLSLTTTRKKVSAKRARP
jgi:fructoselysine-6-P-deglycase FrlB-like protein